MNVIHDGNYKRKKEQQLNSSIKNHNWLLEKWAWCW